MTARIEQQRFQLPLKTPLETSAGSIATRKGVAIAIREENNIGVGEATPLADRTESFSECATAIDSFMRSDREPRRAKMPSDCPAARHAISLAIADLAATQNNQPLSTYLGGQNALERVPVNATVGTVSALRTYEAVLEAIEAGYETVKIKVGKNPISQTIERLEKIAEVTDRAHIRLDANQAWTFEESQRILHEAASIGIDLIEEPLKSPTPQAIGNLDRGPVDIAIDETVESLPTGEVDEWFDAVDAAVLKPMTVGGIDRVIDMASRARKYGVDPIISNTIDGVIARSAAVHTAAALQCEQAAGLATGSMLEHDLGPNILPVAEGQIPVPAGPGLGTHGPWETSDPTENDR